MAPDIVIQGGVPFDESAQATTYARQSNEISGVDKGQDLVQKLGGQVNQARSRTRCRRLRHGEDGLGLQCRNESKGMDA